MFLWFHWEFGGRFFLSCPPSGLHISTHPSTPMARAGEALRLLPTTLALTYSSRRPLELPLVRTSLKLTLSSGLSLIPEGRLRHGKIFMLSRLLPTSPLSRPQSLPVIRTSMSLASISAEGCCAWTELCLREQGGLRDHHHKFLINPVLSYGQSVPF